MINNFSYQDQGKSQVRKSQSLNTKPEKIKFSIGFKSNLAKILQ
jgi:hypothetical protein